MRNFRISLVAVAAAALAAAAGASALPVKSVPFTANYSGQASTKVDDATHIATILANGTGKGTLIGAGKLVGNGTGDSSQQPCVPFGGTGTISGPGGKITWKAPTGSTACGDEGGHTFTVKGVLTVVKATGKLAKAKGAIRYSGIYSHDDGSFSVKLTGTLKK